MFGTGLSGLHARLLPALAAVGSAGPALLAAAAHRLEARKPQQQGS